MIRFETVNELALKVTCQGGGVLYTKAGAFIAGESAGGKNYTFEKVLFGPQQGLLQAAFGALTRRMAGENLPLMKVNFGAFTGDCDYNVRFLGMGVVSQKGIVTSTLTGRGDSAYVAVLSDGNPLVMNNRKSRATISVDPDAVICWMGQEGDNCDPQIRTDINWKTLIGQASGESYAYEWGGNQPVTVIVQPSERKGGIRLAVD